MTKTTITANAPTLLKFKAGMGDTLGISDKVNIPKGKIAEVEILGVENNHFKVKTSTGKEGFIWPQHWLGFDDNAFKEAKAKQTAERKEVLTGLFQQDVKDDSNDISQPNASLCQSACVCMGLNLPASEIWSIREQLTETGQPAGSPYEMARVSEKYLKPGQYIFDDNASLSEMRDWLRQGEFLVSHSWFTGSGHVTGYDGCYIDPVDLSYKFDKDDPWDEFDFANWRYKGSANYYDGFYSSYGEYAATVAGQSPGHAHDIYLRGELDSNRKGAWVHRYMKM